MRNNEEVNPILQIRSRLEEAAPEIVDDMLSTLHAPGTPAAVKVRIYEMGGSGTNTSTGCWTRLLRKRTG